MTTFAQPTDPDDRREEILVTMDSDTALDRRAVAEGLKPFADPGVASVAGFELAYNQYQGGLFTMVGGLAQTVWQLNTCGAQNVTGRVQVNRGTLAFYRSVVFRAHAEGYLDERWFGRRVEFSDDSRATLTAQRYGRSVQQPTCFQFTLTPLTWGHTLRQRLRWMRGSQVRDVSRLRELPAGTYAFWMVHLKWVLYFLASVALGAALAIIDFTPVKVAYLIGMPLLVAYLCALRYLTLRRSDETLGQQLATFALAPLVVLRSATVFKVLRLYALATCLKVDVWGTRAGVEVEAVEAPVREPLRVGDGW
jgi:hyaluronan synthase